MLAFVTVGTFEFDLLVQAVLEDPVLRALQAKGYTELVVQCGNSEFELAAAVARDGTVRLQRHGVEIELWKFKSSLDADYARADLVSRPCRCAACRRRERAFEQQLFTGAGTILDVLRRGKALIVVPNATLLHNHQAELASALAAQNHLKTAAIPCVDTIAGFDAAAMARFQPFDGSRFRALVDREMGF
ncbi:glycosyltransferase family 1 protein [Mycena vulgaris]|nr:glycosyltransferase family 1 protein [Mycena vulgaris]